MIKITEENRTQIVDQYINVVMEDVLNEMPKYKLYNYAMNFLLEQKTNMNAEDLEAEILNSNYYLYNYNNKLNNKNRLEIIEEYVNAIISELATEIPKYTLFDYARRFLLSEIKLLSNECLEEEIIRVYPSLLEEQS